MDVVYLVMDFILARASPRSPVTRQLSGWSADNTGHPNKTFRSSRAPPSTAPLRSTLPLLFLTAAQVPSRVRTPPQGSLNAKCPSLPSRQKQGGPWASIVGMAMMFSGRIPRPGTRLGLPTLVSVTDLLGPPPWQGGVPQPSLPNQWGLCSKQRPFSGLTQRSLDPG